MHQEDNAGSLWSLYSGERWSLALVFPKQELNTLDERFGYGQLQDPILYDKLRVKKQSEINQVREKLDGTEIEISNLDFYIEKSIEISQNIQKYWRLGSLDVKRKIQKMVFPEGIVVDTSQRTYLTSNVNSLFLVKSQFMSTSEDKKEKLPTKIDEESSLVAEGGLFHDPQMGAPTKKKPALLIY